MSTTYAVILAAGKGTRMKSDLHKVLHRIGGRTMADHLLTTLHEIGITKTYFIIGHGAESLQQHLDDRVHYCMQKEQLGTAHAVLQAEEPLGQRDGTTLVINGDTPLITSTTIQKMLALHKEAGAFLTLLTTQLSDPTGYGRIEYAADGTVARIVEDKDATPAQKDIREVNVGLYCVDNRTLFATLKRVTNNNKQGEYYFTDLIDLLQHDGKRVVAYRTDDVDETVSINDRIQLSTAEDVLRRRINKYHMQNGVTLQDPQHTYIEADVRIGTDTTILAGTHLRGSTVIGEGCTIGPDAELTDATIGAHVHVTRSVIIQSTVDDHTAVGPFAYIRPESAIGKHVKIGDFVEVKKSTIGDGTKVSHLSYIGDAEVGTDVNVGCGTITVNYDGVNKHKTTIQNNAFIGSNVNLIAPVTVGRDSIVAAGSTITRDVPEGALAIARERQANKEDFAAKMNAKRKSQS